MSIVKAITRSVVILLCSLSFFSFAEPATGSAWILKVEGAISPASSDLITRNLQKAHQANAEVFILQLDTPGGLSASMRDIIKQILASPVPVVTFVAPKGARAASAGTYILYASHVAAMASATNLGAATPVQIGAPQLPVPVTPKKDNKKDKAAPMGTMQKKITNDAVAYIRGLAKLYKRNADWAEKAVREGASLTAVDALKMNVIDLMADDVDELLNKLDGRQVVLNDNTKVILSTKNLIKVTIEPDWRNKFLSAITNPNVAYLLMLIGVYGIIFEFYHPGVGVPGVVGAISLLLAAYALQMLPLSYAGIALILLGIGLMMAEAFAPSFGILGLGGVVAFITGSIFMFDTELEVFKVALPLIAALSVVSFGFLVLLLSLLISVRNKKTVSGIETLIGALGVATEDFDDQGMVKIEGELWNAITQTPLSKGSRIRVNSIEGLKLGVEPETEE